MSINNVNNVSDPNYDKGFISDLGNNKAEEVKKTEEAEEIKEEQPQKSCRRSKKILKSPYQDSVGIMSTTTSYKSRQTPGVYE